MDIDELFRLAALAKEEIIIPQQEQLCCEEPDYWIDEISSDRVCRNCGVCSFVIGDNLNYRERDIVRYFPYQRMTHFNNLLKKQEHLTSRESDLLRKAFMKIQHPFEKARGSRHNFLNYSFVFDKLATVLNIKLKNLKMLKAKDKLKEHELIWDRMLINT